MPLQAMAAGAESTGCCSLAGLPGYSDALFQPGAAEVLVLATAA